MIGIFHCIKRRLHEQTLCDIFRVNDTTNNFASLCQKHYFDSDNTQKQNEF
jgi:hypothetical protein